MHPLENNGKQLWMPNEVTILAVEKNFVKENFTPRQRADKVREIILKRVADSNGVFLLKRQGKCTK